MNEPTQALVTKVYTLYNYFKLSLQYKERVEGQTNDCTRHSSTALKELSHEILAAVQVLALGTSTQAQPPGCSPATARTTGQTVVDIH